MSMLPAPMPSAASTHPRALQSLLASTTSMSIMERRKRASAETLEASVGDAGRERSEPRQIE
jgi:hypothetical protein